MSSDIQREQSSVISRRLFVATLVGVCILSAGIGSGAMFLAKTGPVGAQGIRGPAGPRGPEGLEGSVDTDGLGIDSLESEISELQGRVGEVEELEGRVSDLELSASDTELSLSSLCSGLTELNVYC